jgi:hypothetical protein
MHAAADLQLGVDELSQLDGITIQALEELQGLH